MRHDFEFNCAVTICRGVMRHDFEFNCDVYHCRGVMRHDFEFICDGKHMRKNKSALYVIINRSIFLSAREAVKQIKFERKNVGNEFLVNHVALV